MQTSNAMLTVGRGELYFDRFLPGTDMGEGELYLGNTPGFSVKRDLDTVSRITSYRGRKYVKETYPLSEQFAATVTTDNMSFENIALWFGGEVDYNDQPGVGFITEQFKVKRGRFYQLGKTVNIFGFRYVESITLKKLIEDAFDPIDATSNILVDRTAARFSVLDDATDIQDGDVVEIRFQNRRTTTRGLIKRQDEVVGSLRFVANNPFGSNKDYFFPSVRMTPDGELPFKGDQWLQFSWQVDMRKLNPKTEYLYVMQRGEGIYTRDEQGIVDYSGVYIENFPYWESQFDDAVNATMASRGY